MLEVSGKPLDDAVMRNLREHVSDGRSFLPTCVRCGMSFPCDTWLALSEVDRLANRRCGALSAQSIIREVRCGHLVITPFDEKNVGPSSYDLTVKLDEPLLLEPFRFHLLSSCQRIQVPADIQGQVHGRSSIGRKAVLVHFTAGFIDPGFPGDITYEVMALHEPVLLKPDDRIAQIGFQWLDEPTDRPYRGRYMNQTGATASRFQHADEE